MFNASAVPPYKFPENFPAPRTGPPIDPEWLSANRALAQYLVENQMDASERGIVVANQILKTLRRRARFIHPAA
jgi:hypothetical protein